jgi:hypothetical protein
MGGFFFSSLFNKKTSIKASKKKRGRTKEDKQTQGDI